MTQVNKEKSEVSGKQSLYKLQTNCNPFAVVNAPHVKVDSSV